jgi:uncharacterized membrane protein
LGLIAFLLFFVAGVGFGYAAPGRLKWFPLVFPLLLFIVALVTSGFGVWPVVKLLIALALTVAGVIVGRMLDERGRQGEASAA